MSPAHPPPEDEPRLADEVIERLYEVAVDPARYESLLDRWEALMAPHRGAAGAAMPGLRLFETHVQRADQVLDRVIAQTPRRGAQAAVRDAGRTAAFAIDRALVVLAANEAAEEALAAAPGTPLARLSLAAEDAALLSAAVARLFRSGPAAPAMLRARGRGDRLTLLHLRLVPPEPPFGPDAEDAGAPFVLVATSEIVWPPGFSEMLRGSFDLTQAEAEVMRALAEGASLAGIAEARGRSVETVRAQLKALMAKTETRSQAELVRLTLATMEMSDAWGAASAALPAPAALSRGTGALEPRPFGSLVLPDGRRMEHLTLGDPQGRPVLFLPLDYGLVRWPASAEAEAARRGLRVIVPVRAGYGRSTPLPRGVPHIVQVAEDHARLLDHLGVATAPILSLGGDSHIAFAFMAAYPERARALVACAGTLPLTRPEQYERMDKWHRFILAGARYTPHLLPFMVKAGFALARRIGKRGFIHAVYGKSAADIATFELPEVCEAMVCGSEVALSDIHSAHDAFAREVIAHETTDWSEEVAAQRGRVPIHFLNGLQDPQVPPRTLAEFQEDYPWIDFRVFPDAGQLLFFLKWREVLPLVERYVA